MKLAWFRPRTLDTADPLDDTRALIAALASTHHVDVFSAENAHNFVWMHFRTPYELCVFELDNTDAHAFAWPYLLQYGGVLVLRALTLHDSRARALERERRLSDYIAEFEFNHAHLPRRHPSQERAIRGTWPMLRIPLLASRITVVPHSAVVTPLQEAYPEARIRYAPLPGVPNPEDPRDIVVALRWPYAGEPQTEALAGMAAGKPVIVFETEATADWPMLDPQTWRTRGADGVSPIGISIDPRDEEHSLALAMRRLSADAGLRAALGSAGQEWWKTHASPAAAVKVWLSLLDEAALLESPTHPHDWPAHVNADGTQRAREILGEVGATQPPMHIQARW
jgi:hypothetical protein